MNSLGRSTWTNPSVVPALFTILALALVPACETKTDDDLGDGGETSTGDGDGDQGGDGDGDGDNESSFGDCGDETITVLDDLAMVPAGFDQAPAELIAAIEGEFAGTFTWGPSEGGWDNTHAGTESPLSAMINHGGGEVRLVEVELAGQPPADGFGEGLCSNRLSFDVEVDFATDDGVFAETWTVPMTILADPGEFGGDPAFSLSLDFATHMGSLGLADFMVDEAEAEVTDLVLYGQVSLASLTGDLGMEVIYGPGPDSVAAFGLIAEYSALRL